MSQIGLTLNRGAQQNIQQIATIMQFTDIGLNYVRMLDVAGRWRFDSSARYRFTTFDGATFASREDNYFTIAAGINYIAKDWFRAGLSYSYTDLSTSFGGLDYGVHRVGLDFVIGY